MLRRRRRRGPKKSRSRRSERTRYINDLSVATTEKAEKERYRRGTRCASWAWAPIPWTRPLARHSPRFRPLQDRELKGGA